MIVPNKPNLSYQRVGLAKTTGTLTTGMLLVVIVPDNGVNKTLTVARKQFNSQLVFVCLL